MPLSEKDQAFIDALGELRTQINALQKQINALELMIDHQQLTVREMRYAGTWHAAASYRKGNFVTHGGGLWACLIDDIRTTPGQDFDGWQLAVKSIARG